MDERQKLKNIDQLMLKTEDITDEQAGKQIDAVIRGYEILQKKKGVILADDVGMGKTFEALGLIFLQAYNQLKKTGGKRVPSVLVIVPSVVLRKKWEDDINKFFQKCVKNNKVSTAIKNQYSNPFIAYSKEDIKETRRKLVVCSVNALFSNPLHRQWDIIIIDEAHQFKNPYTKRYALFDNSKRVDVEDAILNQKFQKLILMTATPFQLQASEITNLLLLFTSAKQSPKVKEALKLDLKMLSDNLVRYEQCIQSFEKAWTAIPNINVTEVEKLQYNGTDLEVSMREMIDDPNISAVVKKAISVFVETKIAKTNLELSLAAYMLRNSKHKSYREEVIGSLIPNSPNKSVQLTTDEELFYLLVRKFLYESNKYKKTFTVQVLQETTSSFSTLDKYSISTQKITARIAQKSIPIKQCILLIREGIKNLENSGAHPKARELKVNLGLTIDSFNTKLDFEKALIFCRFVETASGIKKSVNQELQTILEMSIPQEIRDYFRKKQSKKTYTKSKMVKRTKVWRFSKRFETVQSQVSVEIHSLLESLYEVNPKFKNAVMQEATFVTYSRTGIKRYKEIIANELESALRSKLKEDFMLFKIMKTFQVKSQNISLRRKVINRIMKESVSEVFNEELWGYIKRAVEEATKNSLNLTKSDVCARITKLIEGLRKQDFAEVLSGETKSVFQGRLIEAFNTPFNPKVLIVTQIGQEGIDLQRECSKIIHYDLWWNPAIMEQRVGRIDRIGSKVSKTTGSKLQVFTPIIKDTIDEDIYKILKEREKWFELIIGKDSKKSKVFNQGIDDEKIAIPLPAFMVESLKINLEPNIHVAN